MPPATQSGSPALPAATVVLLRNRTGPSGAETLEVFLVERPPTAAFMARAHVFPGGRVDPGDRDARLLAVADGASSLAPGAAGDDPDELAAHGLAAIRELFEEAGVLLARPSGPGDTLPPQAQLNEVRSDLRSHATTFAALCLERGWRPALDRLTPLAHWVTPAVEKRRFDTLFFLAELPEGQTAHADGVEAVFGHWISPREACERYDAGLLSLAPPTARTLDDLASMASAAEAQAWARTCPHVIVMPHPVERDGTIWLVLPGDPLHPDREGPGLRPPTRFTFVDGRWRPAKAGG